MAREVPEGWAETPKLPARTGNKVLNRPEIEQMSDTLRVALLYGPQSLHTCGLISGSSGNIEHFRSLL
jgi:hypothetical protein